MQAVLGEGVRLCTVTVKCSIRAKLAGRGSRERRVLAAMKLAGQPGTCSWAATCSQC